MSYLERTRDPGRRTTAVAGVIAVHALIGYVLVTGLVETIVPRDERPLIGLFDPAPPPPPPPSPTPEPSPAARRAQRAAPLPAIPLTPTPNPTVAPFDPHTPIDIPVRVPIEVPAPTPVPSASFAPKAAAPANDPGQWIRTEDYPARDIREENEGTAFFRLVIGSNGKVTACEITQSSGHPGLDAATCRAISRRARFEPAIAGNGQKVVGTYTSRVRWVLPR